MASYAVRFALAAAFVAVLFAVRWDGSLDHFDFQVWRAAEQLTVEGVDPYDADVLNAELQAHPERYGQHWQRDDADDEKRMHLFNPPSWLLQLRVLGGTAFAMSLAGALAAYGSIVMLGRRADTATALGHLGAATYVFVFAHGITTFRLGQVGLVVAGLVGVRLVLSGRRTDGIPIALLSFKPHLALATALPALARAPRTTIGRVAVPSIVLIAAASVVYDPQLWFGWIDALVATDRPEPFDDITLRTLSSRWPLPGWTSVPLLVLALGTVVMTSRRWHRADRAVATLWSLALVVFLSGHAFAHDWLWVVFIPPVCRWSTIRSIVVAIVFATTYTLAYADASQATDLAVSLQSLTGLVTVVYLGWATARSHADASDPRATTSELPERAPAVPAVT